MGPGGPGFVGDVRHAEPWESLEGWSCELQMMIHVICLMSWSDRFPDPLTKMEVDNGHQIFPR